MVPRRSTASLRFSPLASPCQSHVESILLPRFEILLGELVECGNSWRLIIMSSRTVTVVTVRARFFMFALFGFSGCELKSGSIVSSCSKFQNRLTITYRVGDPVYSTILLSQSHQMNLLALLGHSIR